MKLGKLFKFLKKGAKKAKKPGAAAEAAKWPEGTKIGVFGHQNSGKTVYFTVLYHEGKVAKNIQISVTDNDTSAEFLSNFRSIWGIAPAEGAGTIVDQRGEREFPDPTVKDKILQFNAILDRKKKIPVVTYDYNGEAVSISGESDQSEKVKEFMAASDGLLFFFDPKIMGAEMEIQARASAFVNMLEKISPLKSRLPIPVGLVINKADTLPGYQGEEQAVLIDPEDEQFLSENFDLFLEKVLNRLEGNKEWTASVRNLLVKLREFLRVVVGRTLDFQIFFTSNTGNKPEKIGADVGRSIYQPPDKIRPSGVKEPFYWILNAIERNKQLNVMRKVVKYTALISVIWIVLYSIPFLYHFGVLLSKPTKVERSIIESVDNNIMITSSDQRGKIYRAYRSYGRKWLVREFFPGYGVAAENLADLYYNFNVGKAIKKLDGIINNFTYIVKDRDQWPKYNPGKDSLIYDESHTGLLEDLRKLHVGDEESILFLRSDRVLGYWDLFAGFIKSSGDSSVVQKISKQVDFDRNNAENYSGTEEKLGDALLGLTVEKKKKVQAVVGLGDYSKIKETINNSSDPAYLLGRAVKELEKIKGKLSSSAHSEQISAINSYLNQVNQWKKRRTYTCVLETVPDMGHLHIEVTGSGQSPSWSKETQLLEGEKVKLKWKIGDDIHIAFDELKYPCTWGKKSSDKRVLQSEYALFDMEGELAFQNIGKTVTIRFEGGLGSRLPKLK
jgi:GTPase SAR1 family protein